VSPVGFVARTQARRRWRALVALALFVGLLGGLSLSLVAGSRRSATVVDRYLSTARPYDLAVFSLDLTRAQVLGIPGVVRADPGAYVGMVKDETGEGATQGINGHVLDFEELDPTWRLLDGSVPDGSDPNEVLVNEFFVRQFGLSVGDTVDVRMFARDQRDAVSRGVYEAKGPRYRMRITGVVRPPMDVAIDEVRAVGVSSVGSSNGMAISDTFYDAHRDEFLDFGLEFEVELAGGPAGRERFMDAVRNLAAPGSDPPIAGPAEETRRRSSLSAPVDLETGALLALGAALAVVGAVVTALVLRAEQRSLDEETPTLRGLGLTSAQLGAVSVLRALPVALVGAGSAVGVSIALSGRYPIGIGRQLELDGGTDVNVAVLALGALAMVAVIVATGYLVGLPRRARRSPPSGRATLARRLGRAGAPTDLVLGTQLVFERGRGVRAVPSRPAIAVGAGALAIVTAVGIYVGGVDRLYTVPDAHGWEWDAAIGNSNFPLADETAATLAADDRIAHRTQARYGDATVNGRATEFLAFDADGDAPPQVISGRLPETATELALGRAVLDDLGIDIGSVVDFTVAEGEFDTGGRTPSRRMRVVGEVLAPIFGESDVSDVGVITLAGVAAAGGDAAEQFVLTRLRDGPRDAQLRALRRDYTEEIITDAIPARIVNLHRVRRLPLVGIGVAGVLGTIVLVYTLAISARARSRELAIMRALGLPSSRLRRVLVWQGGVLTAGMLLIGLPIGLVLGVAAWNRVADGLGVATNAVIPPLVFVLVPLALLVAVVASVLPARRAARTSVSALLRTE
jgi:hypothetical protein